MSSPEQSADGTPHVAYFDQKTQLSFVWNGYMDQEIEVCHGGYGEPVIDTIRPSQHIQGNFMPTISGWLEWFELICVNYIITYTKEEGTE